MQDYWICVHCERAKAKLARFFFLWSRIMAAGNDDCIDMYICIFVCLYMYVSRWSKQGMWVVYIYMHGCMFVLVYVPLQLLSWFLGPFYIKCACVALMQNFAHHQLRVLFSGMSALSWTELKLSLRNFAKIVKLFIIHFY